MTNQTPPQKTTEEKMLDALLSIKSILQFFALLVILALVLQGCMLFL